MRQPEPETLYPYQVRAGRRKALLLWTSTVRGDRFKLTENGSLITAATRKDLQRALGSAAPRVRWEELASFDLNDFWLKVNSLRVERASSPQTCNVILDGWNFLDDMLATLAYSELLERSRSSRVKKIYDKLFFGSNLPAVTPKVKSYGPLWTADEIRKLRALLRGLWKGVEGHF